MGIPALFILKTVLEASRMCVLLSRPQLIQNKELDSAGLLVNEEKSLKQLMQIGEWLGFVINTNAMTFQIPETKVLKHKNLLGTAITDE